MSLRKVEKLSRSLKDLNVWFAKRTDLLLFYPFVETQCMELVHTNNFGNFLSFFDGVIANGAIIINTIGKVRGNAYLIGFGILFIKKAEVGVSEYKIESEIKKGKVDGFSKKYVVIDVIVLFEQVQFFQERHYDPNGKKVDVPAKEPRGFAYVNFNSLKLAMLVLQQD